MEYSYNDFDVKPDPPHQPLYFEKMLEVLTSSGCRRILDAGCGDGNFAQSFFDKGFLVDGIDGSESGIRIAQSRGLGRFMRGSLYDDFLVMLGEESHYDAIYSVEVIEHLYDPKKFIFRANQALAIGGLLIVTTPYWGYLKNLGLALTNRIDRALTVMWDGGHIKHFSAKTLTCMVEEQGFRRIQFFGAGRPIPFLWSGMMIVFTKEVESV